MRYLFIVILLAISSSAYGQQELSDGTTSKQFEWGLFYSSDINESGEQIKIDQYTGYTTEYNHQNFSAGLTAAFNWRSHWSLRSGVTYADRKFTGTYFCHTCYFIRVPESQDFNLAFLQIPVAIRYYPFRKKLSFFGELGFLNQLLLKKPAASRLETNTYSVSGLVGAGIKYNLAHRLSVQLSAQYSDGWSKMFTDTEYSYRILGIRLSLLKQF
jgi:opacity protein-like surface antigen